MKLVTVTEMRAIEKEADARGLTYEQMMENAGLGLADVIIDALGDEGAQPVAGLVGSGNNGGDTLIALAALAQLGWEACAYLVLARPADDPLLARFLAAGGTLLSAEDDPQQERLTDLLNGVGVVLDGILGTGARLPLAPEVARVLAKTAELQTDFAVVAVDCPSGMDCDSGAVAAETLRADITVCMAAPKVGMLRFPAFDYLGQLEMIGIGLADDLPAWAAVEDGVMTAEDVRALLPERKSDAHKGTFGTVMIAAGSMNYPGAALLAAKAAYRVGAGLVRLAVPGPLQTMLAGQLPEATWVLLPHQMGAISQDAFEVVSQNLERVTAVLVGPGLGMEDTTAGFIRQMAGGKPSHPARGAMGFDFNRSPAAKKEEAAHPLPPLVVDADGLKLLVKLDDWHSLIPAPAVLTPHPGEMAIMSGLSVEEVQADRLGVARRFAQAWGHVVVLKGALTVIARPDGRVRVIPVASAALARAGTGDVLAGLIVGLRAQGLHAFDAACAGAWIHANAGLAAAGWLGTEAAVLAGDVLDSVPEILQSLNANEEE
jgi:NAD(P)H-hydrate epimerase